MKIKCRVCKHEQRYFCFCKGSIFENKNLKEVAKNPQQLKQIDECSYFEHDYLKDAAVAASEQTQSLIKILENHKYECRGSMILGTGCGECSKCKKEIISSNELINQYDSNFYKELKTAVAKKDFRWILDNVDKVEVIKKIKEQEEREIDAALNYPVVGSEEFVKSEINKKIAKIKAKYDLEL